MSEQTYPLKFATGSYKRDICLKCGETDHVVPVHPDIPMLRCPCGGLYVTLRGEDTEEGRKEVNDKIESLRKDPVAMKKIMDGPVIELRYEQKDGKQES